MIIKKDCLPCQAVQGTESLLLVIIRLLGWFGL